MTALEIKIGEQAILVLPKDVAKALGLREGQHLHASQLPDGSLRIGPYDPKFDKAMRIADKGDGGVRRDLQSTRQELTSLAGRPPPA